MKKYTVGFILVTSVLLSSTTAFAQSRASLQEAITDTSGHDTAQVYTSINTSANAGAGSSATAAATVTTNGSTTSATSTAPVSCALGFPCGHTIGIQPGNSCFGLSHNLQLGSRGEEVRQLQMFLNQYTADTQV